MEIVQSIDLFESLLTSHNKKEVISNFYMLIDEYSKYINNRNLFYYKDEQNLYLYLDKHDFLKLYYFVNDINRPYCNYMDLPQVIEIVYRGEKKFPTRHIDFWNKSGFSQHLSRDCYFLKNKNIPITLQKSNINIKNAKTENDLLFSKKLIEENLDIYTGDQLSLQELKSFADANLLYIAYQEDKLCGVLQVDFKNGVFWLGHIVIEKSFRGKGIAKVLVEYYLKAGIKRGCNLFQLWVIQENIPAVNLYKKFGFNYLNKSTYSMLKK